LNIFSYSLSYSIVSHQLQNSFISNQYSIVIILVPIAKNILPAGAQDFKWGWTFTIYTMHIILINCWCFTCWENWFTV